MSEEILDLVDEKDQVIGKMERNEIYKKGLKNFRVVNVFIVNSKNQVWIPRRTANKRLFPLCLDMSMGGHVESGETYEEAFRRELKEELLLEAGQLNYREIGKLNPQEHDVSAFMKVYEIRSDEEPNYNEGDFVEAFWFEPRELVGILEREEDKGKGDLVKLLRRFY